MTYRYHSEDPIKRNKLTLTEDQLHDLKCYFVSDYVNDLSDNELKDIVYEFMLDNLHDYNFLDIKEEIEFTFNKRYFKKLISQVSNNKSPPISDPW